MDKRIVIRNRRASQNSIALIGLKKNGSLMYALLY